MNPRHIIVCEGINPAKAHKLAAFADDLEIGEELGRAMRFQRRSGAPSGLSLSSQSQAKPPAAIAGAAA